MSPPPSRASGDSGAAPWWDPRVHADRRPFLIARARISAAIRAWLAERDFLEVEPAALQLSPGADPHVGAFATAFVDPSGACVPLFLHASPEFACKKLLAAGETRIAAFGRVFRNGDLGPLHAPEFTLLEWYRVGEPLRAVEEDAVALLRLAAATTGAGELRWRGRSADPFAEAQRLSVDDAFRSLADVDLSATLGADGWGDARALAEQARRIGVRAASDDTWSDLFSKILSDRVEPRLGLGRPVILHSYPMPEAAYARSRREDPRRAARFELYCCGVELANGFDELTDVGEQRRRLEREGRLRASLGGEAYPIDEEFLAALALMPPACGCALGFDRLALLASGADRLDQVVWTPFSGLRR